MVGPKNQYTQRKPLYFENTGSASGSKIEVRKKWSPKLTFLNEKNKQILSIFDMENRL